MKKQGTIDLNDDTKRLKKDTFSYGIAVIIPALIGVMSISLYTRIFSVEQYGEYNLVFNTIVLITTLFSQWIQQSIQRYRPLYKDAGNLERFNSNLVFLIVMVSIIILTLGLIGSSIKSHLGRYGTYYWISVLFIITQFIFLVLGSILQSDFKSKVYKNYNVLTSLLKFTIGLTLIYYFFHTPISIIYGLVLGQIIIIVPMFRDTGLSIKLIKNFFLNDFISFIKQFMIYGFPMIGWFIGNSVLNLADRYMLEGLGSIKDVGIYSANYAVVSASLGLLTTPLLNAAHPIIMNKNGKLSDVEIKRTISFFTRVYLIFSLPLLGFVVIFYSEIADLFLGEGFREGSVIIPILFFGLIFWNLGMYGHKGYEIKGKTKIMLSFVVISAGLNIILNWLLIPSYGYKGSAIATLISMLTYPLFIYIFSHRYIKWSIDFMSSLKICIAVLVASVVVNQLKAVFKTFIILELITLGLLGLFIYIILLFFSKEINYAQLKSFKK